MSRIVKKKFITIMLAAACVAGSTACVDPYTAATVFSLGYLTRMFNPPMQTTSTCYLNGSQVDCSAVAESPP